MLEALHIAATGMHSQQQWVEMISNNIANLNTSSFKKSRMHFADMLQPQPATAGQSTEQPQAQGVGLLQAALVFAQGDLKQTGSPLDFAIDGSGFFEMLTESAQIYYSRDGHFHLDQDGYIVNAQGDYLSAMIQVPAQASQWSVSKTGEVYITLGQDQQPQWLATIELAQFINPEGLRALGEGRYQPTERSGDAQFIDASESADALVQGYLEASNVDMVQELTQLMLAQRAYGLNSRVVQVSDELMGIINGLRR